MKTRSIVIAIALGCLLSHGDSRAAHEGKCPVGVKHKGDDAVGSRFALVLKERIAASPRYRLAEGKEGDEFVAAIELVSVDDEAPAEGQSSSIAALVSHFPAATPDRPLHNLMVLRVGRKAITDQAERLLADLDKQVSEFPPACDH